MGDCLTNTTRSISRKVTDCILRRKLSPSCQKALGVSFLVLGLIAVAASIYGTYASIHATNLPIGLQMTCLLSCFPVGFMASLLLVLVPAIGVCFNLFRFRQVTPLTPQGGPNG